MRRRRLRSPDVCSTPPPVISTSKTALLDFRLSLPIKSILIALWLAFLLSLSGVVGAQDRIPAKAIPSVRSNGGATSCHPSPCVFDISVRWISPAKDPDGYRVRWGINGKYRSAKRSNTNKRGNANIGANESRFTIPELQIAIGQTLYIQVRARYDGKKNGPWTSPLKLTFQGVGAGTSWRVGRVP